jgi:hypothetical protein
MTGRDEDFAMILTVGYTFCQIAASIRSQENVNACGQRECVSEVR